MPIHDWQFWVVTTLMVGAVWIVLRAVMPARRRNLNDPSCPNCATGSAASTNKRRVLLTIEKKQI